MKEVTQLIRTVQLTLFTILLIATVSVSYEIRSLHKVSQDSYQQKIKQAYSVCEYSRQVFSGELEDRCGELLDETNTDFVCDWGDVCRLELINEPVNDPEPHTEPLTSSQQVT